jgi:hypothetical protein
MKAAPHPSAVERGTEIYDRSLREVLEAAHKGEYVVVNVDTGEYEVDPDYLTVAKRAAARWPQVVCYATRVGSQTIGRIGAGAAAEPT